MKAIPEQFRKFTDQTIKSALQKVSDAKGKIISDYIDNAVK